MATTQVYQPYSIFTDLNGTPLNAGYIYLGFVNSNPELEPIVAYWDAALTLPAAQPIRTINGYPSRDGSPSMLYTNGAFSITVKNKNNVLVSYSPIGYAIDPISVSSSADITAVLANMPNINIVAGNINNVNNVGNSIDNVINVANSINNVNAVGNSINNVNVVAENILSVNAFFNVYLGTKTSDPTTRNDGSAIQNGDMYFNTSAGQIRIYSLGSWYASATVNLPSFSTLNGGSTSHSDGTNTLNGSARWFLGNNSPSSDDSAMLIGRGLSGSYSSGAHAVRDESSYLAPSGSGLMGYASYDSVPTFGGSVTWNHAHAFQARLTYSGSGTMTEFAAFTNDPIVNSGTVTACRGLQVNNAAGAGTVNEQSGVYIADLTKGANNYGVKLGLSAGSGKYSIYTYTAESYFGGQITASNGQSWSGTINVPSASQRINFAANTNLFLSGSGTISSIASLNDAGNVYEPLFINSSVTVFNVSGTEVGRAVGGGRMLFGTTSDDGTNRVQISGGTKMHFATDTNLTFSGASTVTTVASLNDAGNVYEPLQINASVIVAGGPIRLKSYTVATLPPALSTGAGSRVFVTDANATTFASIVAGGGSNGVPVYSDGTNWRIG